MASNPVPLLSPPPDSSFFLDRIGSDFDEEDADELESNSTSHPTSPEKLDIVSTSSFVFDHRSNASSRSAQRAVSPAHYEDEPVSGEDAANGYLPTGSAVGGTTIVQEEIETIITLEGVSDPQLHDRSVSSHSSAQRNLFPADATDETLNVQLNVDEAPIRVPFPELGLDLVDVHLLSLLSEEDRVSASSEIRLTELKSWDENWLFKQRKKKANSVSSYFAFADLDFASEPVRMFIPNPSHEAKASIGQHGVDDLTDLSEKNSVASLSFSSDSESESERAEPGDRKTAPHQPIMTQGGLHKQSSHSRIVADADHKPQAAHQPCPSESGEEGKEKLSRGQTSVSSSGCPASSLVTFCGENSEKTGVKITAAKESCFAGKVQQRHDLSSPSSGIALPSFVPLSRRMESSRSDPCFVIKPCGASVQTAILVQFCCRVRGSRPLGVAWFKGDHLLTDSDCFRIFSSGNEFVLEIRCTQLQHSDVYSCVVYNGFGEQWADFSLTVKERARSPVTTKPLRATTLLREDDQLCQDRGIDVQFFRAGKSPRIVTQTWAERSAVGRDAKEAKVTTVAPAAAIQSESSPNGPVMTESGTKYGENSSPFSEKEQSTSKWSKSAISRPEKQHSEDGLRKRIPPAQRPVIFSSALRRDGSGDDVGREAGATTRTQSSDDEGVVSEGGIVSLSSRCKDFSVYKRDYFVPSAKDETLNGLDEKVYETSKFFSLREDEKEDGSSSADETSILTTGSPSVSGSLAESYLSQKDSGQGDERDSTTAVDDEDETDDAEERGGVSPSVRKLVRRFSRKEVAAGLTKRSCTYASCSSLHEDCDGKGVIPKLHRDGSPEVAFELTTWSRRDGRTDSISSLYSNCDSDAGSRACSSLGTTACSSIYSPTLDRSVSADDRFSSVEFVRSNHTSSLTVHSPVARSLNKLFRERSSQTAPRQLNRFGSFSMCDIDQIASPLRNGRFGSTATVTGSPTNEGYNSDDSAMSGNTSLKNNINDCLRSADGSVEVMPTKKVSRTIMKRASFWQNRCEKGLLSDSSVAEEFPGMECIYD